MTNKNIYQKEISRIKKALVENYKPEKIILFGSCVKGEMTEDSDLDFVIIKKSKDPKTERTKNIYNILNKLENRLPCDVLTYTPKEFENRLNLGDFFVKDIVKEGKILYEKK
ncbi:nucleotidyltransferase domain-containing protein [Patescibacteria group bacterium]|nr:nucleotidyltransferase domain-containing protein [Patescibacteria group bacterium]